MSSNVAPIPLLDLKLQYAPLREEIEKVVRAVCDSQYFILGPEVDAFESEIARYCSARHAIGVSSGTDALLLALMALGIGPGDEVITTPYSFFATAGSIARSGARPVFVDIDPESYNIDPAKIAAAVTKHTKAIMPVHLFGQCADMDPILAIAESHSLAVIEDAAQAIGADYRGRQAGSIGDVGCFSFFPSKNLGAFGDAGLVTAMDDALADRLRVFRVHGSKTKYFHDFVGGNFRIDALQCAVLRVKLRSLETWTEGRRRNAAEYSRLFAEAGIGERDGVILPREVGFGRHIYNQFVVRVPRRDFVIEQLRAAQIGCEVYYPRSLHEQKCFAELGYQRGDFPESERAADSTLALPIFPELLPEQLARVVETVAEAVRKGS